MVLGLSSPGLSKTENKIDMTSASYQIKSKNSPTKTQLEKPFSLPFNHTSFCQSIY